MSLSMKIKRFLNDFSESSVHYVMELTPENNEKNTWRNSDKDEVENPRSGEHSVVLLTIYIKTDIKFFSCRYFSLKFLRKGEGGIKKKKEAGELER